MRPTLSILAFSLLASIWPVTAMADYAAPQSMEKSNRGLSYLSGGVGDEERDEILAREKDFNLKLVFAEKTGSYMADVKVVVLNTKGQTVLEANSTGPFFLAKLPAGNYRVKVTGNGRAQEAMMAVPAKGRQGRTFIW